ncbi:MDR family MFS transporter [Falsibacillus pallidus]|uniref:MDR family MFS transporter n=1 Tax=Falsibacillus pallidus TaxID=493781 RepID=UPI003D999E0C
MNKLTVLKNQFHPIVWVLLAGTILARGAAFMSLPFLAIYLSKTANISPVLIGITIGMSPLAATIGGFVGGQLSDKFGRKLIMLISLFGISVVFFGFSMASHPIAFIILNTCSGFLNSFFEPTSQALIADITEKDKRMKAFSLRYTAINIGASAGPLLGAYFATVQANLTFLITGIIYLIYGVLLWMLMNRFKITSEPAGAKKVSFKDSINVLKDDKALRYFIIGGILIALGYSQIESNLPQHLEHTVKNGIALYSILLSINAVFVILMQLPISTFVEKFAVMKVMMAGAVFLCLGLFGFGFSFNWPTAIASMIALTIGEILIFPSSSVVIDKLAPDHLRGTYFGANQFRKIGQFIGPIFGGYLLKHIGGMNGFYLIALLTFLSIIFYNLGSRSKPIYRNIQLQK